MAEADGGPRMQFTATSETGEVELIPEARPQINPETASLVQRILRESSVPAVAGLAEAGAQLASAASALPQAQQQAVLQAAGAAAIPAAASAMGTGVQAHAASVADRQALFERRAEQQRPPGTLTQAGGCNSIDDAIGSLRGRYNSTLGTIAAGLGVVVGAITAIPAAIVGAVASAMRALTQAIATGVQTAINLAIGVVTTAATAFNTLLSPITTTLQNVARGISTVTQAVSGEIASVSQILGGAFVAGTRVVPASFACLTPEPVTIPPIARLPAAATPPT
jgi:hypothetical protein